MPWGTPRSYGRNIDVGLECLGARFVPTVGMMGLECLGARLVPAVRTLTWGLNALGQASFLRQE